MVKISKWLYRAAAWFLAAWISAGLPIYLDSSATVTAHSGCMENADNSVEAMEAGVEAGARIVEFDLHFTKDGDPVLSHDTPDDAKTYVTLAEAFQFLRAHKQILANIDVKNTAYIETVPVLAKHFAVADRIFFTGLEEKDISAAKEKCPGIPYYLNASVNEDTDVQTLADRALALGAVGINVYYNNASRRLVRVCHKSGLLVSVWTVNELQPMIEMALMGVDNITTRRPDLTIRVIRTSQLSDLS